MLQPKVETVFIYSMLPSSLQHIHSKRTVVSNAVTRISQVGVTRICILGVAVYVVAVQRVLQDLSSPKMALAGDTGIPAAWLLGVTSKRSHMEHVPCDACARGAFCTWAHPPGCYQWPPLVSTDPEPGQGQIKTKSHPWQMSCTVLRVR